MNTTDPNSIQFPAFSLSTLYLAVPIVLLFICLLVCTCYRYIPVLTASKPLLTTELGIVEINYEMDYQPVASSLSNESLSKAIVTIGLPPPYAL